ncbi:MAG: DUF3794 domain-containing protein [Clostridia bacterium]|nr:DUF3794 domain-containing protein [Clostridia bacterium]
MEIQKTVLSVETYIGSTTAQAQIESAIPLPSGVRSEKVLLCEPEVRVRDTVCTKDGISVTGLLLLHLVVETDAQEPTAFDASATFTHELTLAGVTPERNARASVYVPACTCRIEEGGLRMQATLLLRADVFASDRQTCIAGIDDAKGLETQGETVCLQRRTLLGAHSIRLRETVEAPEDMTLLRTNAIAEVGRIVNGSDGLLLEGTLTATAYYYDGEGGTVRNVYTIPFSDTIDAEPNPQPSATVEVQQLSTSYDAGGELSLEAVLSLGIYGFAEERVTVLSDAYDSEGSFSCETRTVPCLNYVGERTRQTVLREPIYVPGHLKDVTRVLFTAATPAVTDVIVNERDASIDGLLLLSIVCCGDDGRLYGFRTDLPFSLSLEPCGTVLIPTVSVRSVETTGSGRTLSCTVELNYGGEWYRQETVSLTADLTPGAPRDPHEGILIYFPDGNDTIFGIGKRFGIPTSEIRAQNPRLNEPLTDGSYVLLLRKTK